MAETGFKLEAGHNNPTRRQRVRYAVRRLYDPEHAKEIASDFDLLEILCERLAQAATGAYRRASDLAHNSTPRERAYRVLKQWEGLVAQLLPERQDALHASGSSGMKRRKSDAYPSASLHELSRRGFLKGVGTSVAGSVGVLTALAVQAAKRKDRPMTRFGIQIEPQFGFSYQEVAGLAQDAERLGFDGLWVSDHLFWDAQSEQRNCLDAWTLLTALAPVTTRLRLGTLVSCNSYRLPSVLAKVAASFDHLSQGRLEFGIGAGWKEMEYTAYGIPFPRVGVRLAQLEEAVQLMQLLWTRPRASFQGKYYQLERAVCAPKPVQQPLKTWIGGMGEKKLLRIVARHASGWNAMPGLPAEAMQKKLDALRRHCDALGRDAASIDKSLFILCCIVDDEAELRTHAADLEKTLGTADIIRAGRKIRTAGTPEQVADTLRGFQRLGFDYFIAMFPYRRDAEMLERFSRQVVPLLA